MFKTVSVAKSSGVNVYARVELPYGTIKWFLADAVNAEILGESFSHGDAASWIVRLVNTSWEDAMAMVEETVKWAHRLAADQDIVLHHAPGSSSDTSAGGR